MSRKDYVAIATAVHDQLELFDAPDEEPYRLGIEFVTFRIADVLADDNPNFDRERFLDAAIGLDR